MIKELVGEAVKEYSPRNCSFNFLSYIGFWSKKEPILPSAGVRYDIEFCFFCPKKVEILSICRTVYLEFWL